MTSKQFFTLVVLAAVAGGSFIFMRILSPVFGPALTASLRLLIASATLYVYFRMRRIQIVWKENLKLYVVIGLSNYGVPLMLLSAASTKIPANLNAIFNSTTPIFGLVFGALILHEKITFKKIVGLVLGSIGVIIISANSIEIILNDLYLGMLYSLLGSMLLAFSATVIQKYAKDIETTQLTFGTMLMGGLIILPLGIFIPASGVVNVSILLNLIFVSIFSTGFLYMYIMKIVKEIGAMKTFTITYMVPFFAILWGSFFLGEVISITTIGGLSIILAGIYFINSNQKTSEVEAESISVIVDFES